MLRKVFIVLTALILAVVPTTVFSAQVPVVEQVRTCMPQVSVYYYEPEIPNFAVEAKLGGEDLERISMESAKEEGCSYYFLVDVSTSIRPNQIQAVKDSLSQIPFEPKDDFTLITFGLEIQVLLDKETDRDQYLEAVSGIQANERGTVFFDAINVAAELAGKQDDPLRRNIAFVFSDSVDVNLGGYTQGEIEKKAVENNLPIYALGFNTGTKDRLDSFGALARTSGGKIVIVSEKTLPQEFAKLLDETKNVRLAKFMAKSNRITSPTQPLELTYYSGETSVGKSTMNAPTVVFLPDAVPLKVESAVQLSDRSIQIVFNKEVQGANNLNSFKISDESGTILGIAAIEYENMCATITLVGDVQTGTLTIEYPGITDNSMEKNTIQSKTTVDAKGKPPAPTEQPKRELIDDNILVSSGLPPAAYLIIGIVVVLCIIAVLIAVVKKRGGIVVHEGKVHFKNTVTEGVKQYHIQNKQNKVSLQVISTSGDAQVLDVPILGSLFFGRSTQCDVYFDDADMSRQHFVIEQSGEAFVLTNLSETNGTILNGNVIDQPEVLNVGDRIEAGQKIIVFLGRDREAV